MSSDIVGNPSVHPFQLSDQCHVELAITENKFGRLAPHPNCIIDTVNQEIWSKTDGKWGFRTFTCPEYNQKEFGFIINYKSQLCCTWKPADKLEVHIYNLETKTTDIIPFPPKITSESYKNFEIVSREYLFINDENGPYIVPLDAPDEYEFYPGKFLRPSPSGKLIKVMEELYMWQFGWMVCELKDDLSVDYLSPLMTADGHCSIYIHKNDRDVISFSKTETIAQFIYMELNDIDQPRPSAEVIDGMTAISTPSPVSRKTFKYSKKVAWTDIGDGCFFYICETGDTHQLWKHSFDGETHFQVAEFTFNEYQGTLVLGTDILVCFDNQGYLIST